MAVDKIIVTHVGALRAKYGSGYARVSAALAALKQADAARGLRSKVVALDSKAAMKTAGGLAVADPGDERGVKAAIDAVYRKYRPDYLVILGAPDVVPHVRLANPMGAGPDGDDDPDVPSDLPYACEAGWSRRPERFLGPTRVVGRLPDEAGAANPEFLVRLLGLAAAHASRDRKDYRGHFALSAKVWQKSTKLSAETLFGPGATVHTAPPDGPNWSKAQLAPRLHFINCHGSPRFPVFLGEFPAGHYVDAHRASRLPKRVTEGSVIAAECCYGAELYDPAEAEGRRGICSTYLAEGAYGFFGSSTIAYGPSEGNGQADLICRFFLETVLAGASLGRAAIEARQRFVAQYSHLDPSDLKTAVQFILLGDPSVHPVRPVAHALAKVKTVAQARASGLLGDGARAFRRERIQRTGHNLASTVGAAVEGKLAAPAAVRRLLEEAASESGLTQGAWNAYRVEFPEGARIPDTPAIARSRHERTVHVVQGPVGRSEILQRGRVAAIIATLERGRLVHLRRVHSR